MVYIVDYQTNVHENDHNLSNRINVNGFFWEKHEDMFIAI